MLIFAPSLRVSMSQTKKLIISYAIALMLIALFTIASQWLVQVSLSNQESDSRLINLAGRQRMLSQKITKVALLLAYQHEEKRLTEIDSLVKLWTKTHEQLKNSPQNSAALQEMYARISPFLASIHQGVIALQTKSSPAQRQNSLGDILKNEPLFLDLMNKITFQLDKEASTRLQTVKRTEWIMMGVTLMLLVLEALLIFRPTTKAITTYLHKIENNNRLIQEQNNQLETTQEELRQNLEELQTAQEVLHEQKETIEQNALHLQEKNEALLASEEELRQNIEELQATQEVISTQKTSLEKTLQELQITQKQLKKNVWTSNDKGHLIELIKTATDNDEGKQIANVIFEEKMQSSVANKDFAILYRTNSQSRAFEESLRRIGLKYKVIGGLSFYQRKEIKDLIAYLRFTVNQNDEEALKRIINLPKRGIGDSTVLKIVAKAQEAGLSLWQVVKNATVLLGNTRIARPIKEFSDLIDAFIGIVEKKDAFETATYIAKHSGLLQELFDDKTIEGRARYENVQELLNAIKEFVVNPESENLDLSAFLQQVSLLTSADDDKDDDRITLMTIHAAKGLEFKYVYVVGLEEDLFPSQMMLASREDLEEERRLFYVAITRAEIKLTLSYALLRYRFGNLKPCEASRFLMEIDPVYIHTNYGLVAKEVRTFNNNVIGKSNPTPASMLVKPNLMRSPNTITRVVAASDFIASDPTKIEVGMAVTHPKFGDGVVLKKEVGGGELRIKVNFESEGEKTLLMNFAKLMIKR
ncbi:MAG: ATP-dependent DNA helicase [Bacteroidetes bacterium]|nr:MAG: ATP-dependent DNA helicase [Bacteroidota bacterium]